MGLKPSLLRWWGRSPTRTRLALRLPVSDARALYFLRLTEFRPIQRASEISGLAGLVRRHGFRTLLEVGTSSGGTALLIARALQAPGALTTIDIAAGYDHDRLRRAVRRGISARCIVADSHGPDVVGLVGTPETSKFDVVFIDGDHEYRGVRHDTLRFLSYARPGGVLVFHDICDVVPGDEHLRYVGGVPAWWRQIGDLELPTQAFVHSSTPSGFGIGVVHLPATQADLDALSLRLAALPDLERR